MTGLIKPFYNQDGSITLEYTLKNKTSAKSAYYRAIKSLDFTGITTISQTITYKITYTQEQIKSVFPNYAEKDNNENTDKN